MIKKPLYICHRFNPKQNTMQLYEVKGELSCLNKEDSKNYSDVIRVPFEIIMSGYSKYDITDQIKMYVDAVELAQKLSGDTTINKAYIDTSMEITPLRQTTTLLDTIDQDMYKERFSYTDRDLDRDEIKVQQILKRYTYITSIKVEEFETLCRYFPELNLENLRRKLVTHYKIK